MLESLYISSTGLISEQININTVANNLSNINTPAFKKGRANFSEIISSQFGINDASFGDAIRRGNGVNIAEVTIEQTVGELRPTENPLNLAITGQGFFEVQNNQGDVFYTRDGRLQIDDSGNIVTSQGLLLSEQINVPDTANNIIFDLNGSVFATFQNEEERIEIGQIQLAYFSNTHGLESLGGGLFTLTSDSGFPRYGLPGDENLGELRQFHLEASNVDLTEEVLQLTVAQRAYQANARVVQTVDEMLRINNELRR